MIKIKISEIAKLCRQEKAIVLCDYKNNKTENTEQWIGNGKAYYYMKNCPKLTEENVYALFEINNKEDFTFINREIEGFKYSFEEFEETDSYVDVSVIQIKPNKNTYSIIFTSKGAVLVDTKLFRPFKEYKVEFKERITKKGEVYLVVKVGLIVIAILTINSKMTDDLSMDLLKITKGINDTIIKNARQSFKNSYDDEQQRIKGT